MKIVFSDPKTGRSVNMELDADRSAMFMNARINDVVDASALGMGGYKLKITGGSDKSGFPMDASIAGSGKTKVLRRISMTGRNKGQYERKTVRGSTISSDTELVNAVVVEYGEKPAGEIFPEPKPKAPKGGEAKK